MSRKRIKLRIIPKPAEGTRTVFVKGEDITEDKRLKPVFKGVGDTDYVARVRSTPTVFRYQLSFLVSSLILLFPLLGR